ncbi:MAG: HAD family phosphatase [Chloroflexi bacterium]|jgi:Cof subfamily protein (haloacid dehalogenase superfamily)|nr:HAD family phosphatase [Chloroflexota bacterium]
MTYRLIAMDLDGTLLRDDLSMSPRVLATLERARQQDILLTLATGRGYPSMRSWARKLAITTPVIGYQGAVVVDPQSHTPIYQRTFPRSLVARLCDFAHAYSLSLTIYVNDRIYVEDKRQPDEFYDKWFGLPFHVVDDLAASIKADPTKFIIIGTGDELDRIRPEVERQFGKHLDIVRSHEYFLEGLSSGTNKGQALAWLAERLGISRREVMAIGDSGNDKEMVAWAGLGVAMGNASAEARSVADYIAPTVDEDGAAEAIERFCLNGKKER